jgi:hypothetical protein
MSLLENRGTMERRQQPVAASGASATVASPLVFSLSIVHYSLFIAKNSLNFNPTHRHLSARNPQKTAKMIPVMVSFLPVQYGFSTGCDRFSTGKVPAKYRLWSVTEGYGRFAATSVQAISRFQPRPALF